MRLLLAHGGGGFAHFPAKRHRTREGLAGGGGWRGFAETRRGVLEMNARVLDALARGGLRPTLVSPSAELIARDGKVRRWDLRVIRALLKGGQIPLIHGDAVLDERRGFTILSTEELFDFLAGRLHPERIILACDVEGVYLAGPRRLSPAPPAVHERAADCVRCVDRKNIARIRRALRAAVPHARGPAGRDRRNAREGRATVQDRAEDSRRGRADRFGPGRRDGRIGAVRRRSRYGGPLNPDREETKNGNGELFDRENAKARKKSLNRR